MWSGNALLFPLLGALLVPIGNYIEKIIFNDPFGDVNKYYLIRNAFMTWGFIILLIVIKAIEKRNLKFREAMNTISWVGFLKNRKLVILSILASSILLMGTYSQYIGLKFNPLTHYGLAYVMIYLIMVTFMGVVFLKEPLTNYKIMAVILGIVSIGLIWLDQRK